MPSSVFTQLLVFRNRPFTGLGSITSLHTLLVDDDDMNKLVANAMCSILGGYIVLRWNLAARNYYPGYRCTFQH